MSRRCAALVLCLLPLLARADTDGGAGALAWEGVVPRALPPPLEPDARLELLKQTTRVRYLLGADGKPLAEVNRLLSWRVLAPGVGVGRAQVFWSRGLSTVEALGARIVLPSGDVTPVNPALAEDYPVVSSGAFYEAARVKSLPVPSVAAGSVVEQQWTRRELDAAPFATFHVFGGPVAVRKSVFEVVVPSDWELGQKVSVGDAVLTFSAGPVEGGRALRKSERVEGGNRVLRWEMEELPPPPPELLHPERFRPEVEVKLFAWTAGGRRQSMPATLEGFSAWYHQRLGDLGAPSDGTRAVVAEARRAVGDDPPALARWLYEWVASRVRYCAIEVGHGGWIPRPSETVERTRFGDCKDKAALLGTLLAGVGVRSRPVLIHAHRGIPEAVGLPGFSAGFNHMILAVDLPSGTVFADPTSRYTPFGELPAGDEGATVLPLSQQGDGLVALPFSKPADNVERYRYVLGVTADCALEGTVSLSGTGNVADDLKESFLGRPQRDWARILGDRLPSRDVQLREVRFTGGRFDRQVELEAKGRWEGHCAKAGDALLVSPLAGEEGWPWLRTRVRKRNFHWTYPVQREVEVRFDVPDDARLELAVADGRLAAPGLEFDWAVARTPHGGQVSRRWSLAWSPHEPGDEVFWQAVEQAWTQGVAGFLVHLGPGVGQ